MLANEIETCFIETVTPPYGFDPVDCCICHTCFWWRRPSKRMFRVVIASLITCITDVYIFLESLKKRTATATGTAKRQLCTCITPLYISLSSLQDYDVKMPNFTFWGLRVPNTTLFFSFSWTSIQFSRIQLQKNLPTFEEQTFFTDTASILNLLDLRSIMGCPGGTCLFWFTRAFQAKRELQCKFLGKKVIIITSKHGTTIFFPNSIFF